MNQDWLSTTQLSRYESLLCGKPFDESKQCIDCNRSYSKDGVLVCSVWVHRPAKDSRQGVGLMDCRGEGVFYKPKSLLWLRRMFRSEVVKTPEYDFEIKTPEMHSWR